MRRHLALRWRWWMGALAGAGVLVTHALSYQLAQANDAHRHELLHDTGHEMWPPFVAPFMVAVLVLGLAGALMQHAAGRAAERTVSFRAIATRLSLLQAIGWLAVETVERVATGDTDLSTRSLTPVVLGVGVQVVVAVVGAVVLALMMRAVDAWRARRPAWPRRTAGLHPVSVAAPNIRVIAAAWSPRGPPR